MTQSTIITDIDADAASAARLFNAQEDARIEREIENQRLRAWASGERTRAELAEGVSRRRLEMLTELRVEHKAAMAELDATKHLLARTEAALEAVKAALAEEEKRSRKRAIRVIELDSLLHECRDFLDGQADCDCDQDGFIPNRAMSLMTMVDEAID